MNLERTTHPGGTGLRPVVSGIRLESFGPARTIGVAHLKSFQRRLTGSVRQDAGFDRLEACSPIFFE